MSIVSPETTGNKTKETVPLETVCQVARVAARYKELTFEEIKAIRTATKLDLETVGKALNELSRRGAITQHGDIYVIRTLSLWSVVECARIS